MDQYGAGGDDYLLEFYENDDDTGRIAELFHTSAIPSVTNIPVTPPTGASTSTAPVCAAPSTRTRRASG